MYTKNIMYKMVSPPNIILQENSIFLKIES